MSEAEKAAKETQLRKKALDKLTAEFKFIKKPSQSQPRGRK